jgi:bacterioferritin-associated ferredoxin
MYVCVCNAITDSEIRGAADLGARTLDDLSATLGVATCCRRCADCATGVLNKHLEATQPMPGAACAQQRVKVERVTFLRAANDDTPASPAGDAYAAQGAD